MATSQLPDFPSRSRRDRNQRTTRSKFHWWHAGLILVGLGATIFFARPRLSLASSSTALSRVILHGQGTHIVAASLEQSTGTAQSLRVAGDTLWPTKTLVPGRQVRVQVKVSGLFGWQAQRVFTVTTPTTPQMVTHSVSVNVGQSPAVEFSAAVAQVRVQNTVFQGGDRTRIAVGAPIDAPNRKGTINLQARARAWESWGPIDTVHWTSVPWLTASAALVKTGHPDISTAPIDVTFSAPVRQPNVSRWTIAPAVSGKWHQLSATTWQFQPTGAGWAPDTTVTLKLPNGTQGPQAQDGASLSPSVKSFTFQLPQATTLRLQEWLAELGYLPLNWTPPAHSGPSSGWASAYQPPTGQFTWRYSSTPAALRAQWNPTYWTAMTQAAVIAFQHRQHLTVNGIAGPAVWTALQRAVQQHAVNPMPYAYVYVSETLPERLWLWVGGHVVLTTLANTGIPQDPTILGTYAVDERLTFQIMRGTNPNGSSYADPVHWINYFNKSQAVHGFQRASYGSPQSLGCVEVPISVAQQIYPHLYIGALVTVAGPGSGPLVPPGSSVGPSSPATAAPFSTSAPIVATTPPSNPTASAPSTPSTGPASSAHSG